MQQWQNLGYAYTQDINYVDFVSLAQSNSVYMCGDLKTEVPTAIVFYIYREGISKPVYYSHPSATLSNGLFFRQIDPEVISLPGKYSVEVQIGRRILALTEFIILEP